MKRMLALLTIICSGIFAADMPEFAQNYSLLLKAVHENNCEKVQQLIDNGEDQAELAYIPGGLIDFPLKSAVIQRSECIVRALLNAPGIGNVIVQPSIMMPFVPKEHFTPLAIAVKHNDHAIAQLLLEKMKELNIHSNYAHALAGFAKDDAMKKMLLDYE